MILFRLPTPESAHGGTGHAYATRMATCLTQLGYDAAITEQPAAPGDVEIIDGLRIPGTTPGTAGTSIALLHHAASRPRSGHADTETALRERLPQMCGVICSSAATAGAVWDTFAIRASVVAPGHDHRPVAAINTASVTASAAGAVTLLSAGVLTPRKGHALLLDALAPLSDLDWTLTIAGHSGRDLAYEQALHARAAAPELERRVRIVRDPEGPVLDALYDRTSLAVLLTRWEGYPAAAAEAIGRGIALVTTAAGLAGLPEGAGLAVEADDLATLSKALRRVIHDGALRTSLAQSSLCAGRALPSWPTQAALFVLAVKQALT